ncbi:hypothetical protein JHK84_042978 [Glycine max]|nr:hypothetical protein JHK84_042978 [Glycine max]
MDRGSKPTSALNYWPYSKIEVSRIYFSSQMEGHIAIISTSMALVSCIHA